MPALWSTRHTAVTLAAVIRLPLLLLCFVGLFFGSGCDKARSDSLRLSNQGIKALNKNNLPEAQSKFQDAIALYPDNVNAHYGLGMVLVEKNEVQLAQEHLNEALRLKPELTEAIYHLGAIALDQRKNDDAEQHFKKVLAQDPDHSAAHFLLGQVYERKRALKDAEVFFRRAATLDPYQTAVFVHLANLYLRVGAYEQAMAVLREGIRVNSDTQAGDRRALALMHNELGLMLHQQGQYGLAIDELLLARSLDPSKFNFAFNLGWAYASKGDSVLALRYFDQYLRHPDAGRNPNSTIALQVSKHLRARIAREATPNTPEP